MTVNKSYQMKKLNKLFLIPMLAFAIFACQPTTKPATTTSSHVPEWTKNSVLYEVNIRQYTPEGSSTT
jgi:ABC-type uncharacterized transport system auxiliary subunit